MKVGLNILSLISIFFMQTGCCFCARDVLMHVQSGECH